MVRSYSRRVGNCECERDGYAKGYEEGFAHGYEQAQEDLDTGPQDPTYIRKFFEINLASPFWVGRFVEILSDLGWELKRKIPNKKRWLAG